MASRREDDASKCVAKKLICSVEVLNPCPKSQQLVSPQVNLLPRCYQDRTNQAHLHPCQEHPGLWFLGG